MGDLWRTTRGRQTYPELVVVSWWALLDESAIVGGDVPVVGVFLQHVDLQLNLLLLVLTDAKQTETNTYTLLGGVKVGNNVYDAATPLSSQFSAF